jgi:hypothetical protein
MCLQTTSMHSCCSDLTVPPVRTSSSAPVLRLPLALLPRLGTCRQLTQSISPCDVRFPQDEQMDTLVGCLGLYGLKSSSDFRC